jgi:hypothetical protein
VAPGACERGAEEGADSTRSEDGVSKHGATLTAVYASAPAGRREESPAGAGLHQRDTIASTVNPGA